MPPITSQFPVVHLFLSLALKGPYRNIRHNGKPSRSRDDKMIHNIDVKKFGRVNHPFRQFNVSTAWGWISGRMVMRQHNRLRAPPNSFLENVPHASRGIIIRTYAHAYRLGQWMVFDVQKQNEHALLFFSGANHRPEQPESVIRRYDRGFPHLFRRHAIRPPPHLKSRGKFQTLHPADSKYRPIRIILIVLLDPLLNIAPIGRNKLVQGSKCIKQPPRKLSDITSRSTCLQNNRKQRLVRDCRRICCAFHQITRQKF